MSYPENYPVSPEHIWKRFYELSRIPRPSKEEELVVEYLKNIAKENNLEYKTDSAMNIVIYVPGTKGYENKDTVIIQNHMDMVCDKIPEKKINFSKDPIDLLVENGWLTADGTTLGADNGIGLCAALALIDDKTVEHPPLELLFTSDEETGLNGALGLDASMISGKKLINLDTEEWGSVYIGCAGGIDYDFTREKAANKPVEKDHKAYQFIVERLKGGHSGLDIHRGRLSAIKIMADILKEFNSGEILISSFDGGKAHNIIPRYCYCNLSMDEKTSGLFQEFIEEAVVKIDKYSLEEDKELRLELKETHESDLKYYTQEESNDFINLLVLFPHGAHGYYWESEEPLVKHSNNLARVILTDKGLYIQSSLRFFERTQLGPIENQLEAISKSFNLKITKNAEYPSWAPQFESSLLDHAKNVYFENYNEEVKVLAIHAGLECGILKDKIGEIEAISIGPTIHDAHSPSEKLHIESTELFWGYFTKILKAL